MSVIKDEPVHETSAITCYNRYQLHKVGWFEKAST